MEARDLEDDSHGDDTNGHIDNPEQAALKQTRKQLAGTLAIPASAKEVFSQRQVAPIRQPNYDGPLDDDTDDSAGISPEGDVGSIIGVSISPAQARLTSPQTPASEKDAVLEQAERDHVYDRFGESSVKRQGTIATSGPGHIDAERSHEKPLPWRAAPRGFRREESLLATYHEESPSHHKEDPKDASKRLLPFALPSLPRNGLLANFAMPSLPLHFLGSRNEHDGTVHVVNRGKRSNNVLPWPAYWNNSSTKDAARSRAKSTSQTVTVRNTVEDRGLPRRPASQHTNSDAPLFRGSMQGPPKYAPIEPGSSNRTPARTPPAGDGELSSGARPRPLRRSTSDNSLLLVRSLSRVSSLGDDTRFENVQDQINSRFKAIKDSFADTNFKFPSIASFNLSAPRLFDGSSASDSTSREGVRSRSSTLGGKREGLRVPGADSVPIRAQASPMLPPKGGLGASLHTSDPTSRLASALDSLTGDVVIMGGYRGSILRSAKPPHRQVWIPVKVGLNIRKVNLEVGLNPEDEQNMEEHIIPSGMLTNIGPVDISRRLINRLRSCENAVSGKLRIWNYGYDWRLSPQLLSRKLVKFLETLPSNALGVSAQNRGAVVIAHSLGGLLTRHAVNQRPELVSGVVYAGVPQTCVNILGPLRNGDEVLLSSRVLTAQVNFSLRTSFVLLPEDGYCFLDSQTKEEYPVDFFNVNTWIDHRLSPCVAVPVPAAGGGRAGLIGAFSGSLANLPIPNKRSSSALGSTKADSPERPSSREKLPTRAANAVKEADGGNDHTIAPQMGNQSDAATAAAQNGNVSVGTAVTLSREDAIFYLRRTLAETLQFKRELYFRPEHARVNAYPPVSVLYGKSLPTVYGAKVNGKEGIKQADSYDNLAFASGDGVCLARAAMVPDGYKVARGGRVSSDRGHVTLLGDLEGVGQCLEAIIKSRRRGTGLGTNDAVQTG